MIGKIAPVLGRSRRGCCPICSVPGGATSTAIRIWCPRPRPWPRAAAGGWRLEERADIFALARQLDRPHWLYRSDYPGGYLWHASLSLPAEDGASPDERWGRIAAEVVEKMGFGQAAGHAPTRWVAVHHGRSAGGYDHVHVVVNLVREDGTRASNWRDRPRLSKILAQIERDYGLSVVGARARGAALAAVSYAETQIARRSGVPEPARVALARIVRAAATASADEAQFVRRLRATPVLRLRARYAQGGRDAVVGYSVALTPRAGSSPVWFGGGRLAPDLSLPALRAGWSQDLVTRAGALAAWHGDVRPGREAQPVSPQEWAHAARRIAVTARRLAEVPIDDMATWADAAREAAGVYAALSLRLEGARPGPLARASAALSFSAQLREPSRRPRRTGAAVRDFRGAAMVALQAGPVGHSPAGHLLLQQQMLRVMRVLHDAHQARGDAVEAARLTRNELKHQHATPGDTTRSSTCTMPLVGPPSGLRPVRCATGSRAVARTAK